MVSVLLASAVLSFAQDLGGGFKVDAAVLGGKPFSVTLNTTDEISSALFQARKDQWMYEAEVGLSYGIFRLCGKGNYLVHDSTSKQISLDTAIYSAGAFALINRTGYTWLHYFDGTGGRNFGYTMMGVSLK